MAKSSDQERGSITFLALGMLVVLLFVCGVSIDLWRIYSERRALVEVADAAAAAGSNGIDLDSYRSSGGDTVLDPGLAEDLAWNSIANQPDQGSLTSVDRVVAGPGVIEVVVTGTVDLVLLDLFSPSEPIMIQVRSEAAPRASGPG